MCVLCIPNPGLWTPARFDFQPAFVVLFFGRPLRPEPEINRQVGEHKNSWDQAE